MKYTVAFLPLLASLMTLANDGAFRAEGNHLIPMYETQVAVKKEILTIRRINATQARIEVYYEFFNPGEAKTIEVGFEAVSPSGDVTMSPVDGHQPYIHQFTVTLNDVSTPFKVAIVHDSLYYRNGQYKAIAVAKAEKEVSDNEYPDFFYVYHFRASFKTGMNILRHVYTVDLSSSIVESYSLSYVLTAAKRWANHQIDDFTLQIDMGGFQDLCIQNTFFGNVSEWATDSTTKSRQLKSRGKDEPGLAEFFIRKGMLTFEKKNFKPKGELSIHAFNTYYYRDQERAALPEGAELSDKFNSRKDELPFSVEVQESILPPADELSAKILHNLPFARRGYIFKSPEIEAYYKRQPWYLPDPAYIPVSGELTKEEQQWLMKNK